MPGTYGMTTRWAGFFDSIVAGGVAREGGGSRSVSLAVSLRYGGCPLGTHNYSHNYSVFTRHSLEPKLRLGATRPLRARGNELSIRNK